jgi:hypothetical protein
LDGLPAKPRFLQFSLGTILLWMTAAAVGLTILRSFPFAAAVLAVWIIPAGLHTFAACRMLRRRVPAVDFAEKADRFALALLYTALALLGLCSSGCAGIIAILAVYETLGMSQDAGLVLTFASLFATAVPAFGIGGWIFWVTLPRTPDHRQRTS